MNTMRTFRLVCSPQSAASVETLLRAQGFSFETEPFHPLARVLTEEPFSLGASLAARFGRIYIQDRSSMLPPICLAPPQGASVIDMCAAPGSKTGMLSAMVGPDGFVFASEPSPDRLGTLRANLKRVNAANTATTRAQSQDLPFPDESWDWIQLDPPCSGWGTVGKNPKVMDLWSEGKTAPLVKLQRELLTKAAAMLRPGGTVLFSTCTTNVEENEEQTIWAMEELGLELDPMTPPKGFVFDAPLHPGLDGVLRVADESEGQGFYLARFKKPQGEIINGKPRKAIELPGTVLDMKALKGTDRLDFNALGPGRFQEFNGKVFFLHQTALDMLPPKMRWQGFPVGKVAGKGKNRVFRPEPSMRILMPAPDQTDEAIVMDDPQELEALLSGRSVSCPKGSGRVALYFGELALGWASRKGSRLIWSEK